MKSLQVNSLPLKDVIADLADRFNTPFHENCDQYYTTLPSEVGTGIIKGINFSSGLGILEYNCTFFDDFELQFIVNEVHPLKFLFCSEGVLEHRFEDEDVIHTINKYENTIVASAQKNGHILRFKANKKVEIQSLEISRSVFVDKIDCELKNVDSKLQYLFNDVNAHKTFYYAGFYSFQVAKLFEEMDLFFHESFLKKLFLEGKSYEILTQQILQYQDDLKEDKDRVILRKSEIDLIENAATLIRNEISDFESIKKLSADIGLNQRKLQEGFKTLYRGTLNDYVQKIRLEIAESLLMKTDLTISEICIDIGISSKSYFSKLFKDKHGMSPSEFRKVKNKRPV